MCRFCFYNCFDDPLYTKLARFHILARYTDCIKLLLISSITEFIHLLRHGFKYCSHHALSYETVYIARPQKLCLYVMLYCTTHIKEKYSVNSEIR